MTTQDWLYKWFRYALALLPVWWLDAYLLSRWPVWGVTPVLLPVAVAAVSALEGVSGGAGFGFGAGLLWAGAYAGSDGSRVILLTLLGILGGVLSRYALAQGLLGCVLCSAITVGLVELFHILRELFLVRATFVWYGAGTAGFVCVLVAAGILDFRPGVPPGGGRPAGLKPK